MRAKTDGGILGSVTRKAREAVNTVAKTKAYVTAQKVTKALPSSTSVHKRVYARDVRVQRALRREPRESWRDVRRQQNMRTRELQAREEVQAEMKEAAAENMWGIKRQYRGEKLGFFR